MKKIIPLLMMVVTLFQGCGEEVEPTSFTGNIGNISFTHGDYVNFAIKRDDDTFIGTYGLTVSTNVTHYGETGLVSLTWTHRNSDGSNPTIENQIFLKEYQNGFHEVVATDNILSSHYLPKPLSVGDGLRGKIQNRGFSNNRNTHC